MKYLIVLLTLTVACSDTAEEPPTGAENNCVANCGGTNNGQNNDDPFGPQDPADWTSFRNGPLRTGYAVDSVVGPGVQEVWRVEDHLTLEYSAAKPSGAVWGDMLFYPGDFGDMKAFDRHTGEELWSTRLIDGGNGIHSSPAVTESVVLIGTYRGYMHALDRESGEEIWKYRVGNVIGSSPVYVPEHEAIYISHEAPREDPLPGAGYVTKNNPYTGEALWVSPKLHHWPHASVAVDPERKVVAVGANDGVFHAYNTDTGEEIWARDFEMGEEFDPPTADIKTTAAISASRGLLIFGTWDDNIYALDIETGETAWQFDTGANIMGSVAVDDVNGRVYAPSGSPARAVFALDLDTGEMIWKFDAGGSVISSPAISGDRSAVVFGSGSSHVYAVNSETGEEIWRFATDGPVTASPALVGDMIYVAAKEGSLYGLRTCECE